MTACFLAMFVVYGQITGIELESRTHRDSDGEKWTLSFRDRLILPDGKVVHRTRSVGQDGTPSYAERVYDKYGEPLSSTQQGSWGRLELTHDEKVTHRTIDGKALPQDIERKKLADPTVFWFWKTTPNVGDSVEVLYTAANQPTMFTIKYTYQGREHVEMAGRKLEAFKVREDPLGLLKGQIVYTIRWFDDKGMDIQRYHVVNKKEFWTKLVDWR